jgi:hypothetical protein
MRPLTTAYLGLLLLLTACGEESIVQIGGPPPTTPPLAYYAPTPMSPGRAENPLPIIYVPPVADSPQMQAAQSLVQEVLSLQSGLALEVLTVDTHADALAILCDNQDGTRFAAAWLNGPAAVIAEANGCGDRILKATFAGQDAIPGEIVATAPASINNLAGRPFCRYQADPFVSFYSWTVPTLAMQANNLDPTQLDGVIEFQTLELALSSLADGSCYALGVPAGYLPEQANTVTIHTTPPIPLASLFVPPELLLGDREALTQAYLSLTNADPTTTDTDEAAASPPNPSTDDVAVIAPMATDPANLNLPNERRALVWLSGADNVAPSEETDLDTVREFMTQAGFIPEGISLE